MSKSGDADLITKQNRIEYKNLKKKQNRKIKATETY